MKKSILFVINNFNIGGPQKSLLALLHELDYDKYDVDMLILLEEGSLINYLPNEVNIINPHRRHRYAIMSKRHVFKYLLDMFLHLDLNFMYYTFDGIFKKILKRNTAVIKQKFWQKVKKQLPKLEKNYSVAIGVSSGHSTYFIVDCVSADKKINWIRTDYRVLRRNKEIDRLYFSKVDLNLSVSEECKDIFYNEFIQINPKIEVIYNILPIKLYNKLQADTGIMKKESSDQINLLTICRLDPHKGLDIAVNCCKILLEKNLNIKWFVLGEGEYRHELERLIEENYLQGKFNLLGSNLNTFDFINESDIFVHPSRFEGKSNVVDEAKYLCKPIVVTNYSTVKEQIEHMKNGIITEIDGNALAEGILTLIRDKSLSTKFIENLKYNQYDYKISLKNFYEIINSK